MPSLASAGRRWDTEYLIEESGVTFRGVLDQPDSSREPPSFQFNRPRRLLQVLKDSLVKARDVILTPSGQRFLVASPTVAEAYSATLYRVHRLFEVTDQVAWSRKVTVSDLLTGQPREDRPNPLGELYVCIEPMRREDIDRQTHIWQDRMMCVMGVVPQLGDILGGREVKRINEQLGLTFAETQ